MLKRVCLMCVCVFACGCDGGWIGDERSFALRHVVSRDDAVMGVA